MQSTDVWWPRAKRLEGRGMAANGYGVASGGTKNILKLDCGDDCTTL